MGKVVTVRESLRGLWFSKIDRYFGEHGELYRETAIRDHVVADKRGVCVRPDRAMPKTGLGYRSKLIRKSLRRQDCTEKGTGIILVCLKEGEREYKRHPSRGSLKNSVLE